MPSVLNPWVENLKLMQQSVLLAMVRNADGIGKHHPQKELIKWLRRCILKSAFDNRHMTTPDEPGGGNFTGPVANIERALDEFIWARDEMTHHYFNHAMHAFQILGYKYPDPAYRSFWNRAYQRMVDACHLWPETEKDMDARLGDHEPGWRAREDCLGGGTATEKAAEYAAPLVTDLKAAMPQGSSEFSFGAEPLFTDGEEPPTLAIREDFKQAYLGEPSIPYNFAVLYLPGMTAHDRADAVRTKRGQMKLDGEWSEVKYGDAFIAEIIKQEKDWQAGQNALGSSGRDDIYNR